MAKPMEVNVGDKFNKLTIIEELEPHVYPTGQRRRKFLVQCECGSLPKSVLLNGMVSGKTKSCGCYNAAKSKSHGMHDTRQYQCWADMKTRCLNPDHRCYSEYGARGITVCEKWLTFEGFWEDMGATYSDNLTLNRRDNDKGYSADNCEWDTKEFQGHMRRKLKGTALPEIGIRQTPKGRFTAHIKFHGRNLFLGSYATKQEATEAYDHASEFIYFDRPNKTDGTRESVKKYVNQRIQTKMKDYENEKVVM